MGIKTTEGIGQKVRRKIGVERGVPSVGVGLPKKQPSGKPTLRAEARGGGKGNTVYYEKRKKDQHPGDNPWVKNKATPHNHHKPNTMVGQGRRGESSEFKGEKTGSDRRENILKHWS